MAGVAHPIAISTEDEIRRLKYEKGSRGSPVGGRRVSRKQLLRVGAVIGAGSVGEAVLAGCMKSGSTALTTIEENRGRVPEATPGQADIAAVSDVAPNSAVPYTNADNGLPEVLVRLPDGRFVAYRPQIRKLVCPCHGGVVVSGPPPLPLAKVKVEVRNGKVFRVRLLRPVPQQRS